MQDSTMFVQKARILGKYTFLSYEGMRKKFEICTKKAKKSELIRI